MRLPRINVQIYVKDVLFRCLAALVILSLLIPLTTPALQVRATPASTVHPATPVDSSVATPALPASTGAPYPAPQTAANWVGQSIYVGPPAPYPASIPTQAGREYGLFVQTFQSNSIDLKDQNGDTALRCYMVGASKCWQHAYISDGQDHFITAAFTREYGLVAVVDLSAANGNALYHGPFSDAPSSIAVQPGHLYRLYFSYYYENNGWLGSLVRVGIIDLDTGQTLAKNHSTGNPEGSAEDVFLAQETTHVAISKYGTWYSVPESAVIVTLLDLGPATYLAPQRTAAQHDACLANQSQAFAADPVNTRTGNFTLPATDFALPTRGLPLTFARTYNTVDTASGPLGRGWTHQYQTRLLAVSGGLILVTPEGSRLPFTLHSNGSYVPGPGVRATLIKQTDGRFTLTRGDGIVYTFDTPANSYRLLAQTDPQGRTTTLTYTSNRLTQVTAPDGRTLTLTYVRGRISRVTDPAGRSVNYTYTTLSNVAYLTAVQDRSGATWTYSYTGGLMTAFSDPTGATVTNVYDTHGRVIEQYNPLQQPTTFDYAHERTLVTDAANNTTTYSYNAAGALIAVTDALGHTTSYTYDDNFNVIASTDPRGHTTEFTWNNSGCSFSSIADAMGYTTTLSYDARNNLLAITDPLGRSTHFGYTAGDALAAITNTLGAVATFMYDAYGQMTSSTNARGETTATAYDLYGNLTAITDALGHATHLSYDLAGRPTAITDANGHTTTFLYDAGDNLLAVSNPLSGTTAFTYDLAGNLTSVTDANGHTLALAYDAAGRLITMTDALQGQTVFAYNAAGQVIRVTDANGKATHLGYDGAGRLVTVTDALNGQTRYVYDAAGNVLSVTGPTNAVTTFQYDALNRTVAITDALGHATWFGYNAVGNVVAALDPTGMLIQYTYDALDRPLGVTVPGVGQVAAYAYDPAGNLTAVTDANGRVTQYGYDALNRLAQVIDPLSHVTGYGYDPVGNLSAVTDANTHTRTYVYDALNRLVAASNPLAHTTAYGYDAVGNTTVISDADGGVTTVAYDPLNRPVEVNYPTMGNFAGFSVQYAYDAVGNRRVMTDTIGITAYTYDDLNRLTEVTPCEAGSGYSGGLWLCRAYSERIVSYTYDAAGRRTQTLTGSRPVTYTYDMAGRLTTVTDWDGGVTSYTYTADGAVTGEQRPNGVLSTYSYDDANRLNGIQHEGVTQTLGIYTYTLDSAGNRIAITETLQNVSQTLASTYTNNYTYDDNDRLIYASYGAGYTFDYDYDAAGNRTAMADASGAITYTYDAADRLTGDSAHPWQFQYDNRGNLRYDGDRIYQYDGANRLARVDLVGGFGAHIQYRYNGDGLMVARIFGSEIVTYTWDQALELPQVLATSNNEHYLYGHDRIGIERDGVWSYPLPDALGSVRQRSNSQGTVTGIAAYDPFGNLFQREGAYDHFDFTGEMNGAFGLQYLRARWYDPATGRFTQVDPFPGVLSLPGTQHPYAYALNNPLRYTDPSGRIPPQLALSLIAAGVAGILDFAYQASNNMQRGMNFWQATCYRNINWSHILQTSLTVGFTTFAFLVTAPTLLFMGGQALSGVGMLFGWSRLFTAGLKIAVVGELLSYYLWTDRPLGITSGGRMTWAGNGCTGGACSASGGSANAAQATGASLASPNAIGRAGEEAAGITGPKSQIPSLTGTANYRMPDGLIRSARLLREVKNVARLSYTRQLQDFVLYSQQQRYTFELVVRQTTRLSGPLQAAIQHGEIVLRYLPW